MRMNKAELLSAVRLAAKYQSAPTAELMNEVANRLDVTCVALSESLEQRKALTGALEAMKTRAESAEQALLLERQKEVVVMLPLPRRKTADDYIDDVFEPSELAAVYNACRLECEVQFEKALAAAGITLQNGDEGRTKK